MTFKELCKKYNWNYQQNLSIDAQILYADSRGVEIKVINNNTPAQYEITNNPDDWYTKKQLKEKYGWKNDTASNYIKYCKDRGIIVERVGISKSPMHFKIVSEVKTKWYSNPKYPKIEISKLGLIRNKNTKRILKCKNTQGYCVYTDRSEGRNICTVVQRIIMETFNPVENMELLYVDHINGIRDDNRLENLRWVTHQNNMIFRDDNWKLLQDNFNKALQKFGYEELNQKLKELLEN